MPRTKKEPVQPMPKTGRKSFLLKLCLVLMVLTGAYAIYLSAQIADQFEGPKWQVPAQLYARPLTFYKGKNLAKSELIKELKLLGYRDVKRLSRTGEFRYIRNGVEIYRRAFDFMDGPSPAQKIQINFSGDKVSSVRSLTQNQLVEQSRLEPLLIDRLLSTELEDRILVKLDEVPEQMVQALLLVEDRDFYQHHGIKPTAIFRALIANIRAGKTVQGGSTLTQQLVKNHFLTRERSIVRKINEAIMSILIELNYSKDEILQAYLNEVYLGQHGNRAIHGFGLASYFYFARPLNELNLEEMALLVGMIKGPSYFNPRRYPERAKKRRNLVLSLMEQHQLLATSDYQKLSARKIALAEKDRAVKGRHPSYMQLVKRELNKVIANPELVHAGIKVFTSLDPVAQRNAEKTVVKGLKRLERSKYVDKLQAAFIVSDIKTAEIRALVGDRNVGYPGFNRALDMRRHVGSLLKPAVYLTALEDSVNYNLATRLDDKPVSIEDQDGKQWRPLNSDKKFRQEVALLDALANSLNVPTVLLSQELGLDRIQDTLFRLGVRSGLPHYPSMVLGAASISPLYINQLYHSMAGLGVHRKLHAVVGVVNNDGALLYQANPERQHYMDSGAVYLVNYALHQVTKKGTAKQLAQQFKGVNFAAKTGTTDDYRDSWFAGFDRESVVTAWIGRDDNNSMNLSGAKGAMSLFIDYHKQGHPYSSTLPMPEGVDIALFDRSTGLHMAGGCGNSQSMPAITAGLPEPKQCRQSRETQQKTEKKSWWKRIFG